MKGEEVKKWTLQFDMTNIDTCHNQWAFNLSNSGEGIVIDSVEILNSGKGCQGHTKTISALVHNLPIKDLDLDSLSKTNCKNDTSCGMVLAACVESIKKSSS